MAFVVVAVAICAARSVVVLGADVRQSSIRGNNYHIRQSVCSTFLIFDGSVNGSCVVVVFFFIQNKLF